MLQFSQVRLTGKAVYDLVLAETEDVEQAERAEMEWVKARLRAGETPEV